MKKGKITVLLALGAALMAAVLTGCSGENKGADGDVIKLGGLAPLTGNYAEYGKGFQIGFQKAIDEINAKGGVMAISLRLRSRTLRETRWYLPIWLRILLRTKASWQFWEILHPAHVRPMQRSWTGTELFS